MARPQDIGQQFPSDATPLNLPDPVEGRAQIDYGTRPNFNEGFTPTPLSESIIQTYEVREFELVAQVDEALLVKEITVDSDGEEVTLEDFFFVAKPWQLRRSYKDTDGDVNSSGQIIEWISSSRIKITKDTREWYQIVDPPYVVGEKLFAGRSEYTGVSGSSLIDLNTDARQWVNEEPELRWVQIDVLHKDTYNCRLWDITNDTALLDAEGQEQFIEVAKPHILRGSTWKDATINGITYTTGDTAETDTFKSRTATDSPDSETQDIIPEWLTDTTLLLVRFMPEGTGAFFNGVECVWQDTNNGAHAFTERFA